MAQLVLLEHHLRESSLALSANTEVTALSAASWGHWHLLGTKAKLRLLHTPDSKELKGEIWLSGPVSSHLEEFEMACWLADSLSLLSHTDYTANEFHDWSHCQQKPHRKYDCCMAGVKHFFPSQTSVNEKTTSFNKQGMRGTRQVMTDGTF